MSAHYGHGVRLTPRSLSLAALALLGLASGCDRTLDPAEGRSMALGQNLYRAGRLQWWAPAALVPQLEGQQARWGRVVEELAVEGPIQGEGDPAAARLVVCGPRDPAAALLSDHGVRWSGAGLQIGHCSAPPVNFTASELWRHSCDSKS